MVPHGHAVFSAVALTGYAGGPRCGHGRDHRHAAGHAGAAESAGWTQGRAPGLYRGEFENLCHASWTRLPPPGLYATGITFAPGFTPAEAPVFTPAEGPAPTHPTTPVPTNRTTPVPTHRTTPAPTRSTRPAPTHLATPAGPCAGTPADATGSAPGSALNALMRTSSSPMPRYAVPPPDTRLGRPQRRSPPSARLRRTGREIFERQAGPVQVVRTIIPATQLTQILQTNPVMAREFLPPGHPGQGNPPAGHLTRPSRTAPPPPVPRSAPC